MFEELLTPEALATILNYGILGLWTIYNLFTIERNNKKYEAADAEKSKDNKELLTNLNQTIKENTQVLARVNENMLVCQAHK